MFTSSSSLSPTLSSASDDAILFLPNTADYADPNKCDCCCTFHFIRPRKPPVYNQNFARCSELKFGYQVIWIRLHYLVEVINTLHFELLRSNSNFEGANNFPASAQSISAWYRPSHSISSPQLNLPMSLGCWLLLAVCLPATKFSEASYCMCRLIWIIFIINKFCMPSALLNYFQFTIESHYRIK